MNALNWFSLLVVVFGVFIVGISPMAGEGDFWVGLAGNCLVGIGWGLKP